MLRQSQKKIYYLVSALRIKDKPAWRSHFAKNNMIIIYMYVYVYKYTLVLTVY